MVRPALALYEANARLLLRRQYGPGGAAPSLAELPAELWRRLARDFDYLWLMGVWRRSPGARRRALDHAGLRQAYAAALPDWSEEDVEGSPYAVMDYELDPALGRPGELAALRSRLNREGLGLVVDFVPNHLALDHPWTREHPERFVRSVRRAHPEWFYEPRPGLRLAHGRDPYFAPWTDTVQLNFFAEESRRALTDELLALTEVADGVRCDMAMLGLNHVFEQTWGEVLGETPRPREEFWEPAIAEVKRRRPDFLFLAEVYWDLGRRLLELGFDYVYDKGLYDLLQGAGAEAVRDYLERTRSWRKQAVCFIENHDEPRAAQALGPERCRAAATVATNLPGLSLVFDGQLEGRRRRLPVQLVREPTEATDETMARFYSRLLPLTGRRGRSGTQWRLQRTEAAWEGNPSHRNLLVWSWHDADRLRRLVVVNYAAHTSQGRCRLALDGWSGQRVWLTDGLDGARFQRELAEIRGPGLYVELGPWQSHVFDLTAA